MITNHISKKYPAIEVVPTGDLDSDFEVVGEIKEYFAFQETSAAARVGAQFGLIGALFTMNTTSTGEISIVLNNIQIKDSAGNMVSNIGAIEKKWDGQFKIDGYCWPPYWNINEKLKLVVDELTDQIWQELTKLNIAQKSATITN